MELAIKYQSQEYSFSEVKAQDTISLNKNCLMKKLFRSSLCKRGFKSIISQTKFFITDPIYELNFFVNNK